jgi:hypothetical protein
MQSGPSNRNASHGPATMIPRKLVLHLTQRWTASLVNNCSGKELRAPPVVGRVIIAVAISLWFQRDCGEWPSLRRS